MSHPTPNVSSERLGVSHVRCRYLHSGRRSYPLEGAFLSSFSEQGDMQALEEVQAILSKSGDVKRWKQNHAVRSSQEIEKSGRKHDKISSLHESDRAGSICIRSHLYQPKPDNHAAMACERQESQLPSYRKNRLCNMRDGYSFWRSPL